MIDTLEDMRMLYPLARVARAASLGRPCPCNEGVAPMALIPAAAEADTEKGLVPSKEPRFHGRTEPAS